MKSPQGDISNWTPLSISGLLCIFFSTSGVHRLPVHKLWFMAGISMVLLLIGTPRWSLNACRPLATPLRIVPSSSPRDKNGRNSSPRGRRSDKIKAPINKLNKRASSSWKRDLLLGYHSSSSSPCHATHAHLSHLSLHARSLIHLSTTYRSRTHRLLLSRCIYTHTHTQTRWTKSARVSSFGCTQNKIAHALFLFFFSLSLFLFCIFSLYVSFRTIRKSLSRSLIFALEPCWPHTQIQIRQRLEVRC